MLLNYSSFMKLLLNYSNIRKEELARTIFESFTPFSIHPSIDSTFLSKILNGERGIPDKIKNCLSVKSNNTHLKECFIDVIIPSITPPLLDDFIDDLSVLVSNDESIKPRKLKKLQDLSESGDTNEYIFQTFSYAISKPNKSNVTTVNVDDAELLNEVDQICPICKNKLVKKFSNKILFYYSVVCIYPDNLPTSVENNFLTLHPLIGDKNGIENKICLCDECAANYLYTPTIETFDFLCRFKKRSRQNNYLSKAATTKLDDKIIDILNNLKECELKLNDVLIKLRTSAIPITNKIDKDRPLLLKAIKGDNDLYYNYIKEYLSQLESFKISFKRVALEVSDCYLALAKITDDQDEIFNQLVDWIMSSQALHASYRNAAHIVISFFVQNCEVF